LAPWLCNPAVVHTNSVAVPRNVFFEIDDAEYEDGWTWGEEFDLVHFRNMQGAFMEWKFVYREAFRCLKPGGYIEVVDFDNHIRLMSYFHNDPDVVNWLAAVNEASNRAGRPRGDAHLNPNLLKELGFIDVTISERTIPTGVNDLFHCPCSELPYFTVGEDEKPPPAPTSALLLSLQKYVANML
jgi:SAM-dependent methyltransferase